MTTWVAGQQERTLVVSRGNFSIVVEDAEKYLTAAMHHMKYESSLRPRHPSRRKTVIDNVRGNESIFENYGNESVCEKTARICKKPLIIPTEAGQNAFSSTYQFCCR